MKRLLFVSGVLAGGVAVSRLLPEERRARVRRVVRRLQGRAKRRLYGHMENMLAHMPEDSPPRLVKSTLPRLAEQNEEILALLQEQNALIRELGVKGEAI